MGCVQAKDCENKYGASCKFTTSSDPSKFTLETLLSDPCLLRLFREFAEKEHSADWLFFWCDAERYRLDSTPELAKKILNTYLSSDSPCEIDIPHQVRKTIQSNIESNNFPPTLFVHAQTLAFNALAADSYMRFCSNRCADYIVTGPRFMATV